MEYHSSSSSTPPADSDPSSPVITPRCASYETNQLLLSNASRQARLLASELVPDLLSLRSDVESSSSSIASSSSSLLNSFNGRRLRKKDEASDFPFILVRAATSKSGRSSDGSHSKHIYLTLVTEIKSDARSILAHRFDVEAWTPAHRLVEKVNAHNLVAVSESETPKPFLPRLYLCRVLWTKLNDDQNDDDDDDDDDDDYDEERRGGLPPASSRASSSAGTGGVSPLRFLRSLVHPEERGLAGSSPSAAAAAAEDDARPSSSSALSSSSRGRDSKSVGRDSKSVGRDSKSGREKSPPGRRLDARAQRHLADYRRKLRDMASSKQQWLGVLPSPSNSKATAEQRRIKVSPAPPSGGAKKKDPLLASSFQDAYAILSSPCLHDSLPVADDDRVVRGECWELTHLYQLSATSTLVVTYARLDDSSNIPLNILSRLFRLETCKRCEEWRSELQRRRPLKKLDDSDGVYFGILLSDALNVKSNKMFIDATDALRKIRAEQPALDLLFDKHPPLMVLLATVMEGKELQAFECETSFYFMTPLEAKNIGAGLSAAFKKKSDPAAAVDEWIQRFPALQDLTEEYPWTRRMLIVLGDRAKRGDLAMIIRIAFSAGMSLADIFTDIYMANLYWQQKRTSFFLCQIGFLMTTFCIQMVGIIMQNHSNPKQLVIEMLLLVTCLKPSVDAYNVCTGKEKRADMVMSHHNHLVSMKFAELLGESIPGSIFQTFVYLKSTAEQRTTLSVFSILVSIFSSAVVSTMVFIDLDIDPVRRKFQPTMYGLVPTPALQRTAFFFVAVTMSFAHVSSMVLMAVLIAMVSSYALVAYYFGSLVVYISVKLIRDDFVYWIPTSSKVATIFFSILARTFRKTIADMTCLLQERHSFELGGLLFTLNMVWTQIMPYLALEYHRRFSRITDDDSGDLDVLPVIIMLNAVWFTSGALLAALSNHENLKSFFSTETATQYTVSQFRGSNDDEQKFDTVFGNNLYLTKPIESEVKGWIAERYSKWEEELPAWFTAEAIALIPSSYLPTRALEDLMIEGGGKRIGKAEVAQRDSLVPSRHSATTGSTSGGSNSPKSSSKQSPSSRHSAARSISEDRAN